MTTARLRCLLDGDFMHNKEKLARDSMATLHNIAYKPEDWISKGDHCCRCSFLHFHVYGLFSPIFLFLATHLKNDERPTQTKASDCSVRIRKGRPAEKCSTPDQSPCLAFPLSGL